MRAEPQTLPATPPSRGLRETVPFASEAPDIVRVCAWGIMKIVPEAQIQTPFPNLSYKIFISDCCPAVEQRATLLEEAAQQPGSGRASRSTAADIPLRDTAECWK